MNNMTDFEVAEEKRNALSVVVGVAIGLCITFAVVAFVIVAWQTFF